MLLWTEEFSELEACQHMLVHLNHDTWTRGQDSDAFGYELCEAMRAGVHRLLAHEVHGARIDDEARLGCPFGHIIATTRDYLKNAGRLYSTEIAMNLLGSEWRECGLVMLLTEIAKGARGVEVDPKELPPLGCTEQRSSSVEGVHFEMSEQHGRHGKLCAHTARIDRCANPFPPRMNDTRHLLCSPIHHGCRYVAQVEGADA